MDESRSTVLFAPNLAWRDEPIKKKVEGQVGLPVIVENDANATAWGEAKFGAGRGEDHITLITLGTGIGGALIMDGELYRGRFGIGGEFGHYRVVPDGRRCGCGNRGCWEQYASGNALVAEARELARVSPALAGRLLELGDGSPEGISGPEITEAARGGDTAALECFRTVAAWVGQGMADLAAILDPGAFIIGGGLSEAGDLLLDPARAAFENALTGRGHRVFADIRMAELGPGRRHRRRRGPRTAPLSLPWETIRLLSYNVRSMRDDRAALARVIRRLEPDIACVQEAPRLAFWLRKRRWLARRGALGLAVRERPAGLELYAGPRTALLHRRHRLLSPVPGLHRRGLVLGLFEVGGVRLVAASVHLDLVDGPRLRHAEEIVTELESARETFRAPVVIAGDINEEPGGAAWSLLASRFPGRVRIGAARAGRDVQLDGAAHADRRSVRRPRHRGGGLRRARRP